VTLSMLVPLLVIVWQLFASSCVLHNQHVIVEGFSSVATTTTGKTIRQYQQLHPHINNKIRSNIDLLTTSCRSSSSFPSSSSSSASSSKMHMLPPGTAIDIIDGTTQLMSSAAGIIDPMMAAQHIMMKTSTLHLSVAPVEIFDGSSIIDPVVISTSFWSALQRQILSVILGQIFAAVVFSILASFLAPQLSSFRDFILSKLTTNDSSSTSPSSTTTPTKPFIKADSIIVRPEPDFGKLLVCLLIDIIGVSSEAVPILGEFTDIISAPISAAVLQNLFPGSSKFVFLFELTEEILPFTDIIPFATICWIIDTYYPESSVADVFQLGKNYANALETATKTTATATATQQNKFNSFVDTTAETIDSSRESK
jgi:hypothetical protein